MDNKQSFMMYAKRRLKEKNSKGDKECNAYFKTSSENRKKKCSVRLGGYRY